MKKAAAIGAAVLLLAAAGFWRLGWPAYQHYDENRAAGRAQKYFFAGDLRNASITARQALAVNPRNLEACQIMAQLAEMARMPQVLDWRRRVVEIAPTLDNKLKFAATALLLERPPCPMAAQTLDEVALTASNSAPYHVLAAELALKLNRIPRAEAHFVAAEELEPTNQLYQLNLAVLQLRATNATVAGQARATLERLSANTNLSHIALQWLVSDCLRRKELAAAERFSLQLLKQPTVEDLLQHLTILREAERPGFAAFLTSLQNQAITNPPMVHAVANWMIEHQAAAEALCWLTNCPAKLQSEQPVRLAMLDAYMAVKAWPELQSWLTDENWGELEFLRLAAISRAEERQQNNLAANAHWRLALRQAGDRLGPLNALMEMTTAWSEDKPREELLWHIFERFPREQWTRRELERLYGGSGNTRGLNKLYAALAARDGKDFVAKNNFAATAMLLGTALPKAHDTAKEIYQAHPTEPVVASTYAWSLQLQGRTKEGLAVLEKLRPEALAAREVALYYGLLLRADNDPERASKYLALVDRASLLPEEKELLAAAQKN